MPSLSHTLQAERRRLVRRPARLAAADARPPTDAAVDADGARLPLVGWVDDDERRAMHAHEHGVVGAHLLDAPARRTQHTALAASPSHAGAAGSSGRRARARVCAAA
eukprot:6972306-Prymnesium_polylepis.1